MALDMSRMRDTMGYYWGGVGAGRPARRGQPRRGGPCVKVQHVTLIIMNCVQRTRWIMLAAWFSRLGGESLISSLDERHD